jgi:predicted TIM-barrel fold metal-dependent hydrolase
MMSADGIEQAVVSPFEGLFYPDPEPANAALLRQLAGRRNPWASTRASLWAAPILNPVMADWQAQLGALAGSPQVRAIRLAPTFHGYEVRLCAEVAKAAARRGLALIVQVRMEDERHHSPILNLPPASVKEVVAMAAGVPRARIVVSAARLPEVLEVADQAKRLNNIWFDISHFDGLGCIQRACRAVGGKRLLFSTSWPFFYARSAVLKVEEAEMTARERRAAFEGNARLAFALPRR